MPCSVRRRVYIRILRVLHFTGVPEDTVEDQWNGISAEAKGKQKEEEYEDEEITATVTVVEDFDPDTFIHGPRITNDPVNVQPPPADTLSSTPKPSTTRDKTMPKKIRPKKVRYQTKGERMVERTKQRARRTEKAELAGGKASRKKGTSKRNGGTKR